MASHLGVAVRTIQATWCDEKLTWTARQSIVGTLLSELSKERPPAEFAIVFRAFAQIGQQLGDPRFANYLAAWLRGHFIRSPRHSVDHVAVFGSNILSIALQS